MCAITVDPPTLKKYHNIVYAKVTKVGYDYYLACANYKNGL